MGIIYTSTGTIAFGTIYGKPVLQKYGNGGELLVFLLRHNRDMVGSNYEEVRCAAYNKSVKKMIIESEMGEPVLLAGSMKELKYQNQKTQVLIVEFFIPQRIIKNLPADDIPEWKRKGYQEVVF